LCSAVGPHRPAGRALPDAPRELLEPAVELSPRRSRGAARSAHLERGRRDRHEDVRVPSRRLPRPGRVPGAQRRQRAVAGAPLRADPAQRSAYQDLDVRRRKLRLPRACDLRRHPVPQARHHQHAGHSPLARAARPLFWLLAQVHALTGNWGVAIILVTFLLKLGFYPLSEASGRSMAKMKTLQPRIKNLQETYAGDKEKLGRAMMELYQREKINPVAGCLPIIIQIPVFLAFYWVLLESVEMRQAPFAFWIHDLSSRDPWFILPAIMA